MADSEDNDNPLLMRKDIENLTPAELDKLIFAFYKLQAADPGVPPNLNEDSYYIIAGYHGQPFRGAGYGNPAWWGGYCHHGNVLFPTWHRAYLRRLEQALNNVSGYTDVALPYWNEFKATVPAIFTSKTYTFQAGFGAQGSFNEGDITIDNGKIKLEHNPLFSYKLQQCFYDKLARVATNKDKTSTKNIDYSKGKGYETVRCPYSGLVGPNDLEDTERYNSTIDQNKATDELNQNVKDWLTEKSETCVPGMNELYLKAAFESPNYTAFSNTTSAAKWNDDNYGRQESWNSDFAVPLEKPHNGVHLAVGGYSMPDKDPDRPSYPGSNGDMGENDTASFDPIFFFHHCFVDYIFCLWQGVHEAEQTLEIFENYPGTSSIDNQGPTAFMTADTHLNMETPLIPFKTPCEDDNTKSRYLTSTDVVNIKGKACGYDYDSPEIPTESGPVKPDTHILGTEAVEKSQLGVHKPESSAMPIVRLSGISRAERPGSFVVCLLADAGNGKKVIDIEPVFSRWHVPSCANCSNTLEVTAHSVLPRDLRIKDKDNKRLDELSPTQRLKSARDLKLTMQMKILENPRTDMLKEGIKDKQQLNDLPLKADLPPEKVSKQLDPGPSIDILGGMCTSPPKIWLNRSSRVM